MKYHQYKVLIVLLAVTVSVTSVSGQDGLALMKVETGARPAGMGGAFTAMTGTPDAIPYNPAGGFVMERLAVSFGHVVYWDNIRLESGHIAASVSPRLALHGGVRYATIGDMERRGETPTADPLSMFDAQDVSFKAGGAYQVTERIIAGASAGWFLEKIDEWNGWAFNVDLGVVAEASTNLAVGASVTGLGSDLTLSRASMDFSDPINLPTTYRLGGAYTYQGWLTGAADMVYLEEDLHGHIGAEAAVHELFQLRAGYMLGYDTKNFSAGASFVQRNLTVDYAFVPYTKDLGTTHLFNLTFTL